MGGKDAAKKVQNGSKMAPKWLQDGLKIGLKVQNGSKMVPKWLQDGLKIGLKVVPLPKGSAEWRKPLEKMHLPLEQSTLAI